MIRHRIRRRIDLALRLTIVVAAFLWLASPLKVSPETYAARQVQGQGSEVVR